MSEVRAVQIFARLVDIEKMLQGQYVAGSVENPSVVP